MMSLLIRIFPSYSNEEISKMEGSEEVQTVVRYAPEFLCLAIALNSLISIKTFTLSLLSVAHKNLTGTNAKVVPRGSLL
jgi:hypothetical protein